MQQIRTLVEEEFARVNDLIVDQLRSNVTLAEDIGHYLVDAGGKRLRPLLTLLTARCLEASSDRQVALAAIIEFIHTATLLHDDVVDLSDLRRGRPTANARWGNAPSVLVGDFLYTRAFQMLVGIGNLPLMALMADTTNTVAEGEVLQLTKAGDPDTTETAYFDVIESKTAVLFGAATKGAAILADAPAEIGEQLYRYGLHLGIAFQLADDALDYEGDAAAMGKNVGDDLGEGKPTLPLIYTMQHGSPAERELVRNAIAARDDSQLDAIVELVGRNGALEYTRATAERHAGIARDHAGALRDSRYRDALFALTEMAVRRDR
jgi:octaprenyl-diphosphate synthase